MKSTFKKNQESISDMEWLFGDSDDREGKKKNFLAKLLYRDWKKFALNIFLYILQAAPVWVLPIITSDVINLITEKPDGFTTRLLIDAILIIFLLLQNIPVTVWRLSRLNKWVRSTTAGIKCGVVRKLQRLSITYHKEMEEGKIQSKILRDVEQVEGYYRCILNSFVPNLIGTIISVGIALMKSPIVTLFFVLVIPLNVLLTKIFDKKIRKDNYTYRKANESLSAKITTTLQMMTLTKAHGLVSNEGNEVNKQVELVTRSGLKLDTTISWFGTFIWVSSQMLSIGCLFFCVFLALKDIITVGEVVLFQSLFTSISSSILGLVNVYPTLMSGKEAVASLSELISSEEIERDNGRVPVPGIDGKVDFEHVFYHYPNVEKVVVEDFDLHVKQGERIAIVGGSGSGKSTVMNLLIGLLEPTAGQILIDDVPLTEMPMQDYRHFISVVPQNSVLFSGSIRENITYGLDHYSEEQLARVVKDADIEEFLPLLPHGLDSSVGEHGDKLSGGQKQRVSIARALIRNPRILIMDEATSALDNVAEYHVQKAIDKLVQNRTTFIVAHRLSTIRNADRIVVMEEGAIVEVGTYDELIALNGKFSELERLSRIRESVADSRG